VAFAGSRDVVNADLVWSQPERAYHCDLTHPDLGTLHGDPVAVAFAPSGQMVAFTRAPELLIEGQAPLPLPAEPREDTGHRMFHQAPQGGTVSCASCHPEGTQDGFTWSFDIGPRRTPAVAGGILSTAPFHWDGRQPTLRALMNTTFAQLGGALPNDGRAAALERWIDTVPAPRAAAPQDPAQVERGRDVFNSAGAGCGACHSGSRYTNNLEEAVGLGGAMQVPQLMGLADRAPYFHDGRAATLRNVLEPAFVPGTGGTHAERAATLRPEEVDDLLAFLQTL
jgi:cytochrome c peroxidase